MEQVIPLLPQDGGDGSPTAASHLFTANFGRVKYQILLNSLAWQINMKCIGLNPDVMLQGREHAHMCRGGPAAFHIFFNREKVKT